MRMLRHWLACAVKVRLIQHLTASTTPSIPVRIRPNPKTSRTKTNPHPKHHTPSPLTGAFCFLGADHGFLRPPHSTDLAAHRRDGSGLLAEKFGIRAHV